MDELNINNIGTNESLQTVPTLPRMFGPPSTPEQRKAVHKHLLDFCKCVMHGGKTKGLSKFIRSMNDAHTESQINSWLNMHSPIEVRFENDHRAHYYPKKGASTSFDLTSANLDPYYSITPKPPLSGTAKIFDKSTRSQNHNLSDREFQKKIIRGALEEALKDPSDLTKNKVISLLQIFDKAIRKGSPTVSGGLPGLGKHR